MKSGKSFEKKPASTQLLNRSRSLNGFHGILRLLTSNVKETLIGAEKLALGPKTVMWGKKSIVLALTSFRKLFNSRS